MNQFSLSTTPTEQCWFNFAEDADGISRLRADLVTVGIDPVRAPFEHRSRARGVAVSLLTI
jgi:hypothetical protein